MPTATHSLDLPKDPSAPGQAREGLRGACPGHPRLDDAVLCVSELVTNAVLHADSPSQATFRVGLAVLRIEVRDGSNRLPEPRPIESGATSGRGLILVEVLADRWGAEPVEGGKVVWCELDHARSSP